MLPTGCLCGADLAEAPQEQAGAGLVAAVAAMAAAAGAEAVAGRTEALAGSGLPVPFRDLALNELLDCLHLFGTLVLAKTSRESPRRRRAGAVGTLLFQRREVLKLGARKRPELLAAALSVTEDWPDALLRTLDGLRGRFPEPGHIDPMGREFGPVYAALLGAPLRGEDGLPLTFLWDAARAYRAERYDFRRRAKITSTDPVANRLVRHLNVPQLAASSGIGVVYARRAYQRVLAALEPALVTAPDEILVAEFRRRFDALFRQSGATLGTEGVRSALLGAGTAMGLRQWNAPDLLPMIPELQGLQRGARFDEARVRSLLERLRRNARAVESLDGLTRLSSSHAMKHLASPTYNKASLLRDMLAGRFPYCSAVAEPKFVDFYVALEEAAAFVDGNVALLRILGASSISRREVNELLLAAFGAGTKFTYAMSARVRQTAQIPWTRYNSVVLFDRKAVLEWVDRYLSPPGQSVRAALAVGSLAVTGETRPYNAKHGPHRRKIGRHGH